jgi:hypothetical protein
VIDVERDNLGDAAGRDPIEDGEKACLECVGRRVCLEPEDAVCRRDPEDSRPPADMRLLDLSCEREPVFGQAGTDPAGRDGEPLRLDPAEPRIGGDDAGHG